MWIPDKVWFSILQTATLAAMADKNRIVADTDVEGSETEWLFNPDGRVIYQFASFDGFIGSFNEFVKEGEKVDYLSWYPNPLIEVVQINAWEINHKTGEYENEDAKLYLFVSGNFSKGYKEKHKYRKLAIYLGDTDGTFSFYKIFEAAINAIYSAKEYVLGSCGEYGASSVVKEIAYFVPVLSLVIEKSYQLFNQGVEKHSLRNNYLVEIGPYKNTNAIIVTVSDDYGPRKIALRFSGKINWHEIHPNRCNYSPHDR